MLHIPKMVTPDKNASEDECGTACMTNNMYVLVLIAYLFTLLASAMTSSIWLLCSSSTVLVVWALVYNYVYKVKPLPYNDSDKMITIVGGRINKLYRLNIITSSIMYALLFGALMFAK